MRTMHILRGLPGSGKSTYAKKWVAQDPLNRIRVNRDTLRLMAHNGAHIVSNLGKNSTERAIMAARDALITTWLGMDLDVMVDDTNLSNWHVDKLCKIAELSHAQVEIIDLRDVPIDVCIERDSRRTGRERVGAGVIMNMYTQFKDDLPAM